MTRFDTSGPILWLDFIGKILILIGMALFFGSIGVFVSNYLNLLIFDVDFSAINLNNIQQSDEKLIAAMKLMQTIGGGIGMFLVPAFLFPKMIKLPVNSFIQYKKVPTFLSIVVGTSIVFICVPFISWLFQLNQYLTFPESWRDLELNIREMEIHAAALTKIFVYADSIPKLLVNIVVIALVPAICEEFLFRGVLLQYTRMIFKNNWVAIVFSAIVFSGFHGQFYGFLPRLALGIVLGHLFVSFGNIYVPIFTHFLNNAMAVLLAYYAKELSFLTLFDDNYQFAWYWVAASFMALIAIFYVVENFFKNPLELPETEMAD